MNSLKPAFTRAARGTAPVFDSFTFWMLVWAVAIDDERQRREKERRKKREQSHRSPKPKPPAGPRPF